MNKPEILSGTQFDELVKRAEEIWLKEIMIKERGASA